MIARQQGCALMPRVVSLIPPRTQSGEFFDLGSQYSASIARVDDRAGLEQEHRCFG